MPASRSRRATAAPALLFLAMIVGGCAQDVCATRPSVPGDVVGCGGHWDQIYRQIRYPSSPGG
jgi:hypothetical protein